MILSKIPPIALPGSGSAREHSIESLNGTLITGTILARYPTRDRNFIPAVVLAERPDDIKICWPGAIYEGGVALDNYRTRFTDSKGSHAPALGTRAFAVDRKSHPVDLVEVHTLATASGIQKRPFALDAPTILIHQTERHADSKRALVQAAETEIRASSLVVLLQREHENDQGVAVQQHVRGDISGLRECAEREETIESAVDTFGSIP